MNKDDKRARKTDRELQKALISLMKEKELKDITVRELAQKADVHRATFYTHYEDIYDLYRQIEDCATDYICSLLNWEPNHIYKENFLEFVNYLYENTEFCGVLFSNQSFLDKLCAIIKEKYIDICRNEIHKEKVPEIWTAMSEYHIRGYVGLISMLLKKNILPEKEKLVSLLYQLDCHFDTLLDKLESM